MNLDMARTCFYNAGRENPLFGGIEREINGYGSNMLDGAAIGEGETNLSEILTKHT